MANIGLAATPQSMHGLKQCAGLLNAQNFCIMQTHVPLMAFVDDDGLAEEDCIERLATAQAKFAAGIVFGWVMTLTNEDSGFVRDFDTIHHAKAIGATRAGSLANHAIASSAPFPSRKRRSPAT